MTDFREIVTFPTPMLDARYQTQNRNRKDSFVSTLFAYIDPITGSLVLQLLVLGFTSLLVFFKKVRTFVLGLFGIKGSVESIEDAGDIQTIRLDENKDNDQQKAA